MKINCTVFVDNILHSVHYGEKQLDVVGGTKDMKTFSFEVSQRCTENRELRFGVQVTNKNDRCTNCAQNCGGLILQCKARDETGNDNPWHKFKSNNNDEWHSDEEGVEICENKASENRLKEAGLDEIEELLKAGADVIWAKGRNNTVLVGSPKKVAENCCD